MFKNVMEAKKNPGGKKEETVLKGEMKVICRNREMRSQIRSKNQKKEKMEKERETRKGLKSQ